MGIIKVVIYPILIILLSNIVYNDYKLSNIGILDKKLSFKSILIISLIIGLYSLSYNKTYWWIDLEHYNRTFAIGYSFPDSEGLNLIYCFLHIFTTNIDVLLFTVASLSTFIVLLSYRECEEAHPISIVMMFCTSFFTYISQVALKQAIACGFAFLCINSVIKKKYIFTLIFYILASLFHVTALAIIPLTVFAILFISNKNRYIKNISYILIFISLIFFNKIFYVFTKSDQINFKFSNKIAEYTDENGNLDNKSSGIVILKGLPYYLITIMGFYLRKRLSKKINNYDNFLVVSLLGSISYALSYYSYWMIRVIYYYLMTIFVFLGIILTHLKLKSNEMILKYSIGGMLLFFTMREMFQLYLPQFAII